MTTIKDPLTTALVDDLQSSLEIKADIDIDALLKSQVQILDKIFRRFISNADYIHENTFDETTAPYYRTSQYDLALKTQYQCQATAKTRSAISYMEALAPLKEAAPLPNSCKQSEGM